ncbi:ATP-binding protein [Archangium violaceum]|uniref:Novel STAND NTPase 1 domain-containing protein n=1 Tax=Archangium violaceum Cb vi76 TaxID=1406225 RepID=A0A084SNK5_9BACT|nr:ATP-binding protein [Archangium violaceum]KFA90040.1 hypothetical protein Q664_31185 [Archangium violaceum Cb vi76]
MNEDACQEPTGTPFKYFDHFEEHEQCLFAGREDEIQEVLTGVARGRTFVLYGPSGVGKTSLLLAGLFPLWRQRGFHPLRVRILESPVEELCAALASELQCPELAREKAPHLLVELSARQPLIIVLDQFEQFFIRFKHRPQEREDFIAFLGRIYREAAANVRLVFCLQDDSYARLEELRAELPDLTQHGLRLPPLTAYGARQAIIRPLLQVGAHYDEAFVNALVDQLAGWQLEPFVLQVVCGELYRDSVERRERPVRLTREDLERMGGVAGILQGHSRYLAAKLSAERLLLFRGVLVGLITSEHTRRTARVEDLLAGITRMEPGETREVLQRLVARRLVRVVNRPDGTWYELMHEKLVAIIEKWLDEDPEFTRFRMTCHLVSSLSEDTQWRADPHWLLTAEQLAERVDPWKERLRLGEEATEFILRSSLHAHADTIAYWASRHDEFGPGRTTELLLKLLEHPDPAVRVGAALACARLEDGSGRLTTRCLKLALEAPDKETRRAAGSSFARLMRPEDAATLQRALTVPEQRVRALEVMADLDEAGRSFRAAPARERLRARLIVRRRRVERNQPLIQRRAAIGALTGAKMTLVWVLTIGLALMFVLFITVYPQQVTLHWYRDFLRNSFGVVLVLVPFVLVPIGMLIGWRVARRTAILLALHGHEHWGYPTFRSGTIMLSSVLLSCLGLLFLVERSAVVDALSLRVGVPSWLLLPLIVLASSFGAWMLTWLLVALASHCIPEKARAPIIYLWAFLGSACLPIAFEMFLSRSILWAGSWDRDLPALVSFVAAVSSVIASFQSFVVTCALAVARKRLGADQPSPRRFAIRLARVGLVLTALLVVGSSIFFWGADTLPFRLPLVLGQELSLEGAVWKVRDTDYFTIQGPGSESFAMSVQGGDVRTRLLLDGIDVTEGSILVSARPRVLAAITPEPPNPDPDPDSPAPELPPRVRYHYGLAEEPIQWSAPERVDGQHWTLLSLPLYSLPSTPLGDAQWQARVESVLPPDWRKEGAVVLVHPVLLHLSGMEKGRCLGVFGSSDRVSGFMNALVIRNRDDSALVPPPNSQAELFLDAFRVAPGPGGHWSLSMTVSPSRDVDPQQCVPVRGLSMVMEDGRKEPRLSGDTSWMLVAMKMY